MTLAGRDKIPWGKIGKPLEDLMEYEQQIGHYEQTSYDLLSTVVHEVEDSPWRRFLLEGENFAEVITQVIALSQECSTNPKEILESIRKLVETTDGGKAEGDFPLLFSYLKHRPYLPQDVRYNLDQMVMVGKQRVPCRVIAFASELSRLSGGRDLDQVPDTLFNYWYREIIRGGATSSQARSIPTQILAAKDRLLPHLKQIDRVDSVDENTVYERYAPVFKSSDIPGMVEIVTRIDRFGVVRHVGNTFTPWDFRPAIEQIELFFKNLPRIEVMHRFERLERWLTQTTPQTRPGSEGVILTPVLLNHLAKPQDFESLLSELDKYRNETRNGRFRIDNILQRDLEFRRFVNEDEKLYERHLFPEELYRMFNKLKELPSPRDEVFCLSGQHLIEVKRTAYEAVGFLEFLKEFRTNTNRPIVVVGNDRYGRQWVVEPLEVFLTDGFEIRYDRVPSHFSGRLSVPSARHSEGGGIWHPRAPNVFPREFVRGISERMPHIVIVDGTPLGENNLMRYPRSIRSYANWFVTFNDVRAEGDGSKYQHESLFPPNHFPELIRWHEFVTVRRQLQEWVSPGDTYKVTLWAPEPTAFAELGEVTVPCELPDLKGDNPQVVLANPITYRTGDNLPDVLRGTTPYCFDGPEKYVKEKIVFGFGPYGVETRVQGPTTATFVEALQKQIKAEVDQLLQQN